MIDYEEEIRRFLRFYEKARGHRILFDKDGTVVTEGCENFADQIHSCCSESFDLEPLVEALGELVGEEVEMSERTQAKAIQRASGWNYQKALIWLRENKERMFEYRHQHPTANWADAAANAWKEAHQSDSKERSDS